MPQLGEDPKMIQRVYVGTHQWYLQVFERTRFDSSAPPPNDNQTFDNVTRIPISVHFFSREETSTVNKKKKKKKKEEKKIELN